ncbi:MAG: ABC transporter permease subunit [Streptosporangiales bacterium]|nr:ABC transporter permease subunit [Streptosporangiales bacterium]
MTNPRRDTNRSTPVTSRLGMLVILLALTFLILVPMVFIVVGATQEGAAYTSGVTFSLDSLRTVFTTKAYLSSFAGTALLSLSVAALAVCVASMFAWLLARTNLPRRGLLELIILLPLFLSPFVGAIAWVTLASRNSGIVNVTLGQVFGLSEPLVNIASTGGVVWVMVMYFIPYGYILISPALKNMDPSLEEAGYLCGAGPLSTTLRVTIPIVRPAVLSAFFLVAVIAAGVFSIPAVLGGQGGFTPLSVHIYRAIARPPANYPLAAAVGCALLLLVFVGLHLYRRAVRASSRFVTVTARGFRPRLVDLGRLRYAGVALCVGYASLAILLPYAALVLVSITPYTITDLTKLTFTLGSFQEILTSSRVLEAVKNTMLIGVVAPTACVALAVAVSYVVERTRIRGRRALEYLAVAPVAVPGIVFAVGMLWAYVRTPLYATVWILVAVFIASYLPHASRMTGSGLLQIDRVLEDAATVCGASRVKTLSKITVPLSKPSLLSAWIFVFVLTVREINAAIVLYSPDTMVLSVLTWDYVEFGDFQMAAVAGLLQTALLVLGLLVGRFVFRVRLMR